MPRTLPFRVVPALTACLLLSACAFSPGQHLDTSRLEAADSPESARFELVQITPKLIAVQDAVRQGEQIPTELLEYRPESYRIGPGDVLHITVWDYPEMTAPSG